MSKGGPSVRSRRTRTRRMRLAGRRAPGRRASAAGTRPAPPSQAAAAKQTRRRKETPTVHFRRAPLLRRRRRRAGQSAQRQDGHPFSGQHNAAGRIGFVAAWANKATFGRHSSAQGRSTRADCFINTTTTWRPSDCSSSSSSSSSGGRQQGQQHSLESLASWLHFKVNIRLHQIERSLGHSSLRSSRSSWSGVHYFHTERASHCNRMEMATRSAILLVCWPPQLSSAGGANCSRLAR